MTFLGTPITLLPMNKAQTTALDQAHRLLAEHFDGVVLSVNCENEDGSSSNFIRVPAGDAFQALGLLEAAKFQLLQGGSSFLLGEGQFQEGVGGN